MIYSSKPALVVLFSSSAIHGQLQETVQFVDILHLQYQKGVLVRYGWAGDVAGGCGGRSSLFPQCGTPVLNIYILNYSYANRKKWLPCPEYNPYM